MSTTTRPRRIGGYLVSALVALGLAGVAAPGSASAGNGITSATINTIYIFNDMTQDQGDAVDPQLFLDDADISEGGLCTQDTTAGPSIFGNALQKVLDCTVPADAAQAYTLAAGNVPNEAFVQSTRCFDANSARVLEVEGDGPAVLVPTAGETYSCFVNLDLKPILYVDKVIIDDSDGTGPLDSADFLLEIYADNGDLVVSTIIDPSNDECTVTGADAMVPLGATTAAVSSSICAAVPLLPGQYTFGEILPEYGYVADGLVCDRESNYGQNNGAADAGTSALLDDAAFDFQFDPFYQEEWVCTLFNDYVTQLVTADVVVINDNGGTASASDFLISVLDSSGAVVAGPLPDPEPGVGNASAQFVLPIGPYTLQATGPNGYDVTVAVTPSLGANVDAALTNSTGVSSAFRLDPTTGAAGVITIDDQQVATTTTSTTTTTTTTSTTTTTTVLPRSELPATGSSQGQTATTLMLGLGLLLLGGGAVLATRRS